MDTRYIPDDLSVIVTTYNRPQQLLSLLKTINPLIETIVADDGTNPSLKQILHTHVKLYTHDHGGNQASTCRNQGANLATKTKLLFLDDDVTPHGLNFAAHALALEMYDASLGLLPRKRWLSYTDDRMLFYVRDDATLWNFCWSGNLAVRHDVFDSIGGFDADTFNGTLEEAGRGFEDIDFGRRLYTSNYRMCLNKFALAWHPAPHTSEDPPPAVLRNQLRYQEKWGEVIA